MDNIRRARYLSNMAFEQIDQWNVSPARNARIGALPFRTSGTIERPLRSGAGLLGAAAVQLLLLTALLNFLNGNPVTDDRKPEPSLKSFSLMEASEQELAPPQPPQSQTAAPPPVDPPVKASVEPIPEWRSVTIRVAQASVPTADSGALRASGGGNGSAGGGAPNGYDPYAGASVTTRDTMTAGRTMASAAPPPLEPVAIAELRKRLATILKGGGQATFIVDVTPDGVVRQARYISGTVEAELRSKIEHGVKGRRLYLSSPQGINQAILGPVTF